MQTTTKLTSSSFALLARSKPRRVSASKAWHSQYYNAFPLLSDIELYIGQIRDHYSIATDERTAEQWTEEAFANYMRQSFIDHASFNVCANDNKRFWHYYGNRFVIAALVFGIMASIPVADQLIG